MSFAEFGWLFFFSSRRRHTRFKCDWSSDVCSSDLAMRRPYRVAMYRALVDRLARAIPMLGLGGDVIAGFPGETEQDAAATEALIDALPFTYLHVFPYSERRGTEAADRPGRVERATIARRAARLRALGAAKSAAFRRSLVGRTDDVLVL